MLRTSNSFASSSILVASLLLAGPAVAQDGASPSTGAPPSSGAHPTSGAHRSSGTHSGTGTHHGTSTHHGTGTHHGSSGSTTTAPAEGTATPPAEAAPSAGSAPETVTSSAAAAAATTTPAAAASPTQAAPAQAAQAATPPSDLGASELARSGLLMDEQVLYEERYGFPAQRRRRDPHEEPARSYWFFGVSFQESFAPQGMLELFVDRAPTGVRIPRVQLELTRRKDNVDIITSLYWADYGLYGPFLAKGAAPDKVEMVDSNLQAFGAAVTALWSTPFNDVFALEYGFSAGLGGMVGHVVRTEAYPSQGGPHTVDGYAACVAPTGPGQPGSAQPSDPFDPTVGGGTIDTYCGVPNDTNPVGGYTDGDTNSGQQYGVTARNIFHGGSVPAFSARLAPQLSLRIKPIHQLVFRIDTGFDFFSGVFVGAGASYGF